MSNHLGADGPAFPVISRQAVRDIAGFPTEILLQIFSDRVLVLVSQGKVGRMVQVSPPSGARQRHLRDLDGDLRDASDSSNLPVNADGADPSSLSFLAPPDPSSHLTNVFGTPRSESIGDLENLYASQIAAILFEQRIRDSMGGGSSTEGSGLPVVVGLGFKSAFFGDDDRQKFSDVMRLVADVLGM